jgi:ElaB/YqjD/DUF883 family membrane-anchored ribosome-binding protein
MSSLSPSYQMDMAKKIAEILENKYEEDELFYLESFKEKTDICFEIIYKNYDADILRTLYKMPDDGLIRMALDLGLNIPIVLPSIPEFRWVLSLKETNMDTAKVMFEKAYKLVYENPSEAVTIANSTLETIIKFILVEMKITFDDKITLHKLTEVLLKEWNCFPNKELQDHIRNIGSSFINISQNIEQLRSSQTSAHGKTKEDHIIDDPIYSVFIINSVTTVGFFLIALFNKKQGKDISKKPINPTKDTIAEDIPF